MATNTFTGTGVWSDTTKWSLGRAPTIANADKAVIGTSAVCTVDGVYDCGDDTSTALTISAGGTLKFSRTATTELTVRGRIVNAGTWDRGTEADPIPATYTCTVVINDSAVMANAKWTIASSGTPTFREWGKFRNRVAQLTSAALITDTDFPLDDIRGWEVGDKLIFGPPGGTSSSVTVTARAITAVTPGSGDAGTVTVGAALSESSDAGRYVVNVSSNVRMIGKTPQTYTQTSRTMSIGTSGNIELGHTEHVGIGNTTSTALVSMSSAASLPAANVRVDGLCVHDIVSVSGATVTLCPATGSTIGASINLKPRLGRIISAMLAGTTLSRAFAAPIGGSFWLQDPVAINAGFFVGSGSAGGNTVVVENPIGLAIKNAPVGGQSTSNGLLRVAFEEGHFVGLGAFAAVSTPSVASLTFEGVNFATPLVNNTTAFSPVALLYADIQLNACTLYPTTGITRTAAVGTASNLTGLTVRSRDNDPTLQYRYTYGGEQIRDNSVSKRGASSVRFDCWYASNPMTYSRTFILAAGATANVRGSMRYNSTYGTGTPPTVDLSGANLTTQTATCPTSGADTWHDYDLSITNTNAYPTDITITYTGQSAADSTGAYCWFDGVYDSPWVDTAREFGYLYADTAYRTVDPSITVSEATALAYPVTVIRQSGDGGVILVTGAVTARQVYEAVKAQLAQTANLDLTNAQANAIISTADSGATFSTTYDVVVEGVTLTGSFTTTGYAILSYGGFVEGVYTDAAGARAGVSVTAPYLQPGTRVQVYNVGEATELLNDTIGTGGLVLSGLTWTGDAVIRLRADEESMLPLETTGVLTSSGLTFLNVQVEDTVYTANAIDGSTVTEFSADGPNIQVDIDDPDGVTSVQRLYAWLQHYQTTEEGIASDFFQAMTAFDELNYTIDSDLVDLKLDNVSATPVVIAGGYLQRSDGATVIAATSGSIQMDPGRAYLAGAGSIAANIWTYGTRTLTDGAAANVLAIKAKTDNLPAAPAAVGDIPTAAQNADKLLGRNLAGAVDGGRTVKDALRASRNKSQLVGGTLTVYQEDDATPAWTADVTTASRDPVSGIDPT